MWIYYRIIVKGSSLYLSISYKWEKNELGGYNNTYLLLNRYLLFTYQQKGVFVMFVLKALQ